MNIDFKNSPVFTFHILSGSSPRNFWQLLADNNFKIHYRFLPKLLLTIPVIILNIPFSLLEKLLYSGKINKTIVKQPVFILGYPRSGTTFLMYLMSKDPQYAFCRMYECMGPHVIFSFGKVLRMIAGRVLPKKRPMDNLELGADVPKEEEFALGNMGVESMANALYFPKKFSEYFNRFVIFKGSQADKVNFTKNLAWLLKKLSLKNPNKRMLLKSPFNTGRISMLLKLYPDAKFIHIHRHPYTVIASNEKLYESVLPQVSFQEVTDTEMEQHLFYTFRATMEKYFDESKLLDKNQIYEISYDDFISDPAGKIRNIYEQLELGNFSQILPFLEEELKKYSNYQTNIHTDDSLKKLRIYNECKFIYERLGYSMETGSVPDPSVSH